MITRISLKSIFFLDIISVILLAILGNLIFSVELNFRWAIDWLFVGKIIFLSISSISFYIMILEVHVIKESAEKEYLMSKIEKQAEKSIDQRFKEKMQVKVNTSKLINCFWYSLFTLILYFLLVPIYNFFI